LTLAHGGQSLTFFANFAIFKKVAIEKNDMYKSDSAEITVYGCSNPVEKKTFQIGQCLTLAD